MLHSRCTTNASRLVGPALLAALLALGANFALRGEGGRADDGRPLPRAAADARPPLASVATLEGTEREPLGSREPLSARAPASTFVEPALEASSVLELPAARMHARLPELTGLLLDASADDARLAAWYAPLGFEALARARFRLVRLVEAFELDPNASPVAWLLPSDADVVRRELAEVERRITALPVDAVETAPPALVDAASDFERRHALESSEDLHVAAARLLVAHRALSARFYAAHVERREYEVVPESALFS